ncbi:MAG: acyl-CoA dehydrogenase [Proteobacteria bacterium]|nr:acyl-CoA dehydrogenase [Pseudomonadota bacterium]
MIDFKLTEEQVALKETVRKFVQSEIIPNAHRFDATSEFPHEIIRKAWENGLMNPAVPEKIGGLGLGILEDVIMNEEMGAGCLGMTTSIAVNTLALYPILIGGTDEQIKHWITPFLNEPKLASFCLTEPGAGSDAGGLSLHAKDEGSHFILNGSKMWITNAGHAELFTVFATTNKELRSKGTVCLAVPAKTPGISLGKHEDKMGQRCSDTRAITFENVKIPKENMIGNIGDGFKIALKTLDKTRTPIAAGAVGAARAALEYSTKYSKERKQFNQSISNFQGIQFMLADMATKVEAGRLLCYQAAWALDSDQHKLGSYYASLAKRFSADMAMEVATDAVQIYGGYGYTKEYPVEKIMRDVKLVQIYEGTSQIQRVVIARHLLED